MTFAALLPSLAILVTTNHRTLASARPAALPGGLFGALRVALKATFLATWFGKSFSKSGDCLGVRCKTLTTHLHNLTSDRSST
eukprot:4014201-Amphidinium_carterae.1